MTKIYSDDQNVQIAKKEYDDLSKGSPVTIDNGRATIGYVSDVVNNKATGEQAYIITDGNPQK